MYVRQRNSGSLGGLLDGLDLDESYLLDTNNWVSHSFLQTLYARMIEITGDANAVYKMTIESKRFQSLGLLDRIVRYIGNPKPVYAQAAKYNRLLKLNGDVYVHELGESWVLLEDRYHDSSQKTRCDCDYTRAVLSGIPTMFDLPFANVEELECQVAPERYGRRFWPDNPVYGSRGCVYRVRWSSRGIGALWGRLFRTRAVQRDAIDDLLEANSRIQEKYDEVRQLASDLEAANRELLQSRQELEKKTNQLKASEMKYRLLAETVTDVIWTCDLQTLRYSYVSPSVERLLGFSPDEMRGAGLLQMLEPEQRQVVRGMLEQELGWDKEPGVDPSRSRTLQIRQRKKDDTFVWVEVIATFIRDNAGQPIEVLGITRDISERKQAEERLKHLSTHDALTGLHNRMFFEEEMARLSRGRQYPITIVIADVDGLKDANDRLGHAAGDELLKRAALVLRNSFRADEMVARLGGDEFVVLLPKTDAATAQLVLERTRDNVAAHNAVHNGPALHLSLGAATATAAQSLFEAMKQADSQMYREKMVHKAEGPGCS